MRTEYYYDSLGGGRIRACRWTPEGEIKAVVQLVHGIAEHVERYDHFASFLNTRGILVVAEDHMGHGKSICDAAPQGYFNGGWMAAVKDTYRLTRDTMKEFPGVPFVLFGHSMGSMMARTILAKYPDSGIAGAVICGTGWQPGAVVAVGNLVMGLVKDGRKPLESKGGSVFSGYNKRIEHPRTGSDWLSRDNRVVDAYEADPLCGFAPTVGLMKAMMEGGTYIQNGKNLDKMKKDLPVFFIAGGDDPVGNYGKGVRKTAEEFKRHGMEHVDVRIYPLCRHEILNEINKEEVYEDVARWVEKLY